MCKPLYRYQIEEELALGQQESNHKRYTPDLNPKIPSKEER
jgi:hypothetical protein